ncbi:MAG: hypothetical protein ABSE44_04430 [Candidatus Sulfotelmatobacter sp.]|jgi:hypothetical protein
MRRLEKRFLYAACCAFALYLPGTVLAQGSQPAVALPTSVSSTAPPSDEIASPGFPDSPGTARSGARDARVQQESSTQPVSSPAIQPETSHATTAQDQTQQSQQPQRPVGTAAAEGPKVNGITAAQPAEIAIAPGKQHRVRTIVIKVGAIVGAGIALGTVIALSEATPTKPPGAH